jgi:hypothetical protein
MSAFGKKWQRLNDVLQQRRSDLALAVSRCKELKRQHDESEEPAPSRGTKSALQKELAGLRKLAEKIGQDIAQAEASLLSATPAKKKKSA